MRAQFSGAIIEQNNNPFRIPWIPKTVTHVPGSMDGILLDVDPTVSVDWGKEGFFFFRTGKRWNGLSGFAFTGSVGFGMCVTHKVVEVHMV